MNRERKRELLLAARNAIGYPEYKAPRSAPDGGSFVTLRKNGVLRGCIGCLYPVAGLYEQIAEIAREAAFEDPRFPPLRPDELPLISIEISLLTEPEDISSPSLFMPGRDGIIMTAKGRRAVFLPQVAAETGWNREEMLEALSRKAGLDRNAWQDADASFQIFRAEVFSENDL